MQELTLVACSDLHGVVSLDSVASMAIQESANVVVVAGDVQTAYIGRNPKTCFEDDFLKPVRRLGVHGIEVVMTPGNHDFFLRQCLGKDNRKRFLSNLHILCDKREKLFGLMFYGTPWVPTVNGQWCYEEDDEDLAPKFLRIPKGVDVLIAHSPPLGAEGELFDVSVESPMSEWSHFGSASLADAIVKKCPRLVVCGHIHTGDHQIYKIGDTLLVNVSLIDEQYRKAYKPTVIRIGEDGGMKFKIGGEETWKTYQSSCI